MQKMNEVTECLQELAVGDITRNKIKDFASFCVEKLAGNLLQKGLSYVKVATEFLNELELKDEV